MNAAKDSLNDAIQTDRCVSTQQCKMLFFQKLFELWKKILLRIWLEFEVKKIVLKKRLKKNDF